MSVANDKTAYRRVCIKGILELETDLHIGTGEMDDYLLPAKDAQPAEWSHYNCIVLDTAGQPYIPGSTLRGLLRSLAENRLADPSKLFAEKWFGKPRGEKSDHGDMGRVRVYDATLAHGGEQCCMSRTAIDPVTGTAAQHQLATQALVKAGAQFTVEIELDTRPEAGAELIQTDAVAALMAVLGCLSGAQLGGGKSVGQGTLKWLDNSIVNGMAADSFVRWLETGLALHEGENLSAAIEPLSACYDQLNGFSTEGHIADTDAWTSEAIHLYCQSPILINNPHDAELDNDTIGAPNLVFNKRNHAEAFIPGSTLKGWFRARCRKILLTLTQGERENTVDDLLGQLFGSTEQASLIRFYDASVAFSKPDEHIQTFNAVDRFTGGVKDGALYTVKALWLPQDKPLKGRVSYKKDNIRGWMQLLLLFAWRDAEEGDLVLGWGKAKGYGRLRLETTEGGTQQWIEKCQQQLVGWEAELNRELKNGKA